MSTIEDPAEDGLEVTPPQTWATGPAPGERAKNEYCENGAKHLNDEATSRRVTADFFREHSVAELGEKPDYWLNQQRPPDRPRQPRQPRQPRRPGGVRAR
ncbi:hypothetical protein [Streptomyces sp. GESEQ-35]|uniref:hypothetical protein n=1 Tax=Streptomyces sp. GESEQ-35 TaxID=2812657 RepID=UPI001B328900|nr:hypothetical protein [Streptomyces sp. GESEQ-35]